MAEAAENPWNIFKNAAGPWNEAGGRTWSQPYVYGGTDWYSMTGYRSYTGGTLNGVSLMAHYQSATGIAGIMAYVFYFMKEAVIVDRNAHRAHGLSVRCVRE